jgi:hypothetical protein
MPAGVIDNGGDEPCLNLKSFLPDMPMGGRHYHDAICTGGGDDDVKCGGGGGMEAIEVVGVVSEMRKAVVFRSRYENGIASDRGGIGEARAGDHAGGDFLCCGGTMVKVEHLLISARVSRTTETFTGHEGMERSPNPTLAPWGPLPDESRTPPTSLPYHL